MIRVLVFLILFFSFSFALEVNEPFESKGEDISKFIVNEELSGDALFLKDKNSIVILDKKCFPNSINFLI